jgi:Ca2+:H+ antiporter
MAGLDQIKRQARKEAWYSDSYNPFGRASRTNTWNGNAAVGTDPELGFGKGPEGSAPLSNVATEPTPESPSQYTNRERDNEIHSDSKMEEPEMTTAGSSAGRPSDPESEATVVERASTRPRSEEEKARHRFLGKWRKGSNSSNDPEEKEKVKKTPWYKGKQIPHQPFTLRNQLQRTIFGSWINILLVCAPVGIGLNYAGVDGKIVFVVNFIAIIPLAGLLSFATEEIALHLGESLGGLLNASFG